MPDLADVKGERPMHLLPSLHARSAWRGGVGGGGWMNIRRPSLPDARVPRARALRRDMTEAEKRLWQRLRQPPFKEHHFRRQATIGPYFCDFASHSLKLVVEVDGGQHADNAADDRRTAYLNGEGYRVLRFWNHEVLKNLSGVLIAIDAAIDASDDDRPPAPDPSPPQAGGGE